MGEKELERDEFESHINESSNFLWDNLQNDMLRHVQQHSFIIPHRDYTLNCNNKSNISFLISAILIMPVTISDLLI